jgi:hypothetical protein
VAAQLGRPAIAKDFLINCFPLLSNFVKTLNTLNNSKSEQGTAHLQGVRDQIEGVELTGWSASRRGGRAADSYQGVGLSDMSKNGGCEPGARNRVGVKSPRFIGL